MEHIYALFSYFQDIKVILFRYEYKNMNNSFVRSNKRPLASLRPVSITPNFIKNAYSSCLIRFGNTEVICTASIDNNIPRFLKGTNSGWLTAEYGMLPASTEKRIDREAAKGKQGGRTVEIQRLIGRSLRSVINLDLIGERQIIIDCDVIQADGGTRTAAITGGYVALHRACQKMLKEGLIARFPITAMVGAVSCGIINGQVMVDLEYIEDSRADVDANFILTDNHKIIEIQGTAERDPFSQEQFLSMLELAKEATSQLNNLQKQAII